MRRVAIGIFWDAEYADFSGPGNYGGWSAVSASLSNNGVLFSEVTDLTANAFTTHILTSNGAFAAADLNGDGIIDVVASFVTDPNTSNPSTAVFLGNGGWNV